MRRITIAAPLLLAALVAAGVSAWLSGSDEAPMPTGIVVVAGSDQMATAASQPRPTAPGTVDWSIVGANISLPLSGPPVVAPVGAPVRFRADDFVDSRSPDPTVNSDNQAWSDGWVREDGVTEINGIPIPMPPPGSPPNPDAPAR